MKVGEIDIKWEMGEQAAADLLQAIQTLADTDGITRVDGVAFKVYKLGSTQAQIRVDLDHEFYGI